MPRCCTCDRAATDEPAVPRRTRNACAASADLTRAACVTARGCSLNGPARGGDVWKCRECNTLSPAAARECIACQAPRAEAEVRAAPAAAVPPSAPTVTVTTKGALPPSPPPPPRRPAPRRPPRRADPSFHLPSASALGPTSAAPSDTAAESSDPQAAAVVTAAVGLRCGAGHRRHRRGGDELRREELHGHRRRQRADPGAHRSDRHIADHHAGGADLGGAVGSPASTFRTRRRATRTTSRRGWSVLGCRDFVQERRPRCRRAHLHRAGRR